MDNTNNMSNYEETLKEAKEIINKYPKLKKYFKEQLLKGWNEEEALLNTYDEWFFNYQ